MRKCRVCQTKFQPTYNSLQAVCGAIECAITHGKKLKKKVAKQAHRELKQVVKIENLSYQHKLTKDVFNKLRKLEEFEWFRERGIEPYCISCGKTKMDWCCAHFMSVGHQGNLRYDRMNTYLGCNRYCNMGLSGNIEGNKTTHGYKKGLIMRFGEEEGQRIIDYCETTTEIKKWHWKELKDFRAECSAKIRELERISA